MRGRLSSSHSSHVATGDFYQSSRMVDESQAEAAEERSQAVVDGIKGDYPCAMGTLLVVVSSLSPSRLVAIMLVQVACVDY